jgi:hypothetical protein
MSKAKKLIESITQYRDHGDVKIPTTNTNAVLEPGIYNLSVTMQGEAVFSRHHLITDELLRFEDERHDLVLTEVSNFWDLRDRFKEMGYTHKRAILMHGAPGSGKSCLMKLVMNDIIEKGDVVFRGTQPSQVLTCLKQFRKVEPERRCVVVLEEVDEMAQYQERVLLELLDGDDQIDGVLYLGTTNYPERLAERMKREGRFDRQIEIPFPPKEGRMAYLQQKIGILETEDPTVLDDIAEATDGMSFGQLKEFLVSVYIYGYDPEETLERMSKGKVSETKAARVIDIFRDKKISEEIKTFLIDADNISEFPTWISKLAGYDTPDQLDEAVKTLKTARKEFIVRDGKKVKANVRRTIRKNVVLTPAQRLGIRKAAIKRKTKKAVIQRKRKISNMRRKSFGLSTQKRKPGEKIR